MDSLPKAILRSLVYADIFDYPLTSKEIWRWLTNLIDIPKDKKVFFEAIEGLKKEMLIGEKKEYFYLKNREEIVDLRLKRTRVSQGKMVIATKAVEKLKRIPQIKMIGITGRLAVANSDNDDDIDLLIVCAKNRLWTTRFLAILLMELLGQRRRPGEKYPKDKICLNLFLDEDRLAMGVDNQNLYLAHEICQLKVIFQKDDLYRRFLNQNQWVNSYLPNFLGKIDLSSEVNLSPTFNPGGDFLEAFTKRVQLAYMKSRITSERIVQGQAFFHPHDCRDWILEEYQKRLKKIGENNVG